MASLLFIKITANLVQSRHRTLDAWSIFLNLSLIIIFYLTKAENRHKKLCLRIIVLEKRGIFVKKC